MIARITLLLALWFFLVTGLAVTLIPLLPDHVLNVRGLALKHALREQ